MSAGDYLGGAAVLLALLAPVLVGTLLLVRRRLPWLAGAERATAFCLLAAFGLLMAHVVPAAFGILGRGAVIATAFAWLGACALARQVEPRPDPAPVTRRDGEGNGLAWGIALAVLGVTVLFWVALAWDQLTRPSSSIDFMNFHLPGVVSWIQSGTLWEIPAFLPSVAPGNYPNNGDVMLLAAALPWHNDFLVHVPMFAFHALTGLAVYALARRFGAIRPLALVAGCVVASVPVFLVTSLASAITDSVMLFGFTAGLVFLIRHQRGGATADLVLAGLGLGLSFGTKWYAVSAVAVVIGVWALSGLIAGRGARTVIRQGAVLAGLIALVGGVWLLRNWIESGNPVFPVKVSPAGITIFDAPPDVVRENAGFTIVDYLTDAGAWQDFILPQYERSLAAPGLLCLIGVLLAAALLIRRRRQGGIGVLAASAACVGLLVAVYAITPYTAGGPEGSPVFVAADSRYVLPALVIAAALGAWAASTVRHGSALFAAAGGIAVLHGVGQVASGEIGGTSLGADDLAAAAGIASVAALGAWIFRSNRGRYWRRRLGPTPVALIAVLGAVAVGYAVQKRFNEDRYVGGDPVVSWVLERAGSDERIGLAGLWSDQGISPVLPAFGPRFENEVAYVGPIVREMLQRYPDRDGFVAAVDRGEYDYLIVGRGRPGVAASAEREWAQGVGFELLARSDRLELYGRRV